MERIDKAEIKNLRTRNLRYKKPALASFGYDAIATEMWEIIGAIEDVQWFLDDGDETLLNALDGDDEAEWEFRMAFADMAAKADQFRMLWDELVDKQSFDDYTVALIGNRYKLIGYDWEEEDYVSLFSYQSELAFTEAGKRVMRHTKADMLSTIGVCMGIMIAFLDLRQSYDYLKATFDILRDENTSLLQTVKEIDALYAKAEEDGFRSWRGVTAEFDRILANLPDRAWIE